MRNKRINLTTVGFTLLLSLVGSLIVASPAAAASYTCTGSACADSASWAAAPKVTRFGYPYNAGTGSGTNCTNYVAWKLSMNGASGLSGLGNANRWDDNARARGITVNNTPAVGSVAQWDTGGYGHVAYVESVNGSSIIVSEANYGGNWLDRRQMSVSEVGSFIHIKDVVVSSSPIITPGDFNGDGFKDLLLVRANGDLALYASDGAGGWLNGWGTAVGSGWNSFSHAFSPGDFNGDGKSDVIGVLPNGNMMLYTGNGAGGWLNGTGTLISTGNIWAQMIAPGDFNSDGFNDVIGVTAAGDLWLYKGNGAGGWIGTGTAIGTGFAGLKFLVTPGDFSGDGNVDLIATLPNGNLSMYTGDGAGGWSNGTGILIGSGFSSATRMVGPGDWNGDGNADVIASFPNGDLRVYTGNGAGSWIHGNGILIGSGW